MAGLLDRMLHLDRRWIFLFVLLSVATPILIPIGLPVSTTAPTQAAFDYIESLKPGDVVLISFDYGPSSAPENDPMAEAFMRQCAQKKLRFIVLALYGLGGPTLASNTIARIAAEYPDLRYGVDYIYLGYKDGPSAVMRRMVDDIAGAFPTDASGKPVSEFPIMRDAPNLREVKLVFTVATGVIGEWWITQVHPQAGTPIIIGPTAVSAPKYYAFLNSGQLVGMLGGMKGAAEYEKLLRARYPELSRYYRTTRNFTATKGMDAQTVLHTVIMALILLGNGAFILQRSRGARA